MRPRAWCRVLKRDTKRMTRKRKKIDEFDFIKIKDFSSAKALLEGLKDKLQTGRKHFKSHLIRDWDLEYIKNSQSATSKQQ